MVGYPLTPKRCARSPCASASTFATGIGGDSAFARFAASAHFGASSLQWPHHGA